MIPLCSIIEIESIKTTLLECIIEERNYKYKHSAKKQSNETQYKQNDLKVQTLPTFSSCSLIMIDDSADCDFCDVGTLVVIEALPTLALVARCT